MSRCGSWRRSHISPSAHFQRQRSLGIVTHLPNPPSVLPDSYALIMADRIHGYDVKSYTKIFPLPVAPFKQTCELVLAICSRCKSSLEKNPHYTWSWSRFLSFHTEPPQAAFKNNVRAFYLMEIQSYFNDVYSWTKRSTATEKVGLGCQETGFFVRKLQGTSLKKTMVATETSKDQAASLGCRKKPGYKS